MTGIGRWILVAALIWVALDGLLVCGWAIWCDLSGRDDDDEPSDRGGHVRVVRRG